MKTQTLTFIEKSRKKVQALINYGFLITAQSKVYQSSNDIAHDLENDESFTLTIPPNECVCFKTSEMGYKLIKPYIKDVFHVEQKSSKTHYLLFSTENKENLEEIFSEPTQEFQVQNTFELNFNKYTLPNYTNKANLYSVENAPLLTPKAIKKLKEMHEKVVNNENNYFLLSNNISFTYNTPMTILRKLGENVISLKALNILELILIYATNSSCLFRQSYDKVKLFAIPCDFFNLEDFKLNQTNEEITNSLNELKLIGLINNFDFSNDDNTFVILSNIIATSIKQYSYKQELHHYSNMSIQQKHYIYTFINYLRYVKNISKKVTVKAPSGNEVQRIDKATSLTITFESLLYNLELEDYIHDHSRLATVLQVLLLAGREQGLLLPQTKFKDIDKNVVKYLLTHRDMLHEVFVLNMNEPSKEECKHSSNTTYFTSDINGRNLVER